jgi:hypothetical protein
MIIDIPSSDELEKVSVDLLIGAWSVALATIWNLEGSNVAEWDDDFAVRNAYRLSIKPTLNQAISNVAQAHELGLKSKIAAISPYLLLSGDVRSWPRSDDGRDISFYELRTVDASDLMRLHNMVCPAKLDERFVRIYDETRRNRNRIAHLGGGKAEVDAKALLRLVLTSFGYLHPNKSWVKERYAYEENHPHTLLGSPDFIEYSLVNEFESVQELLEPKYVKTYYGFDKRKKKYICIRCTNEQNSMVGERSAFAQIKSQTVDHSILCCSTCGEDHVVVHGQCNKSNCTGGMIYKESYGRASCVSCGQRQDI